MKQLVFFIAITILLIGCKPTNETSNNNSSLKKNELVGTVINKEIKKQNRKELYFRINDKDYFIKLTEGYLSEGKLLKYENQLIKIKGEIKNGPWEHQEPASFGKSTPPKARHGEYIVIYKIYN